jgi:hypothetical protein
MTQTLPVPPPPGSYIPADLAAKAVSYNWPVNGIEGDDVNVATANATAEYYPRNQGNKADMIGTTLAVDVTTPRGWIGPQDPYAPPVTPTLASLDPVSRVVAPTDDMVLTATGSDFLPSSVIEFAGNVERTTYVSPTQLTTIIRGDMFTGPDPAIPVRVLTAGLASDPLTFEITAAP